MTNSTRDWAHDLSRYGSLLWTRTVKHRVASGIDYQNVKYRALGRKAVERLHPHRIKVVVDNIVEETRTTKTLKLCRVDGPLPPYRPGQYVNLFLKIGDIWTSRPYSMTSAPGHWSLDLTVREVEGGFVSKYLCNDVMIGDTFETSGPGGHFHHEPLIDGDDLVFIAGGSGITPFISMLRHEESTKSSTKKIRLFYGSRSDDDVIFEKELERLEQALPEFSWDLIITEPSPSHQGRVGFIDEKLLAESLDAPQSKTFYVCGPKPMYDAVSRTLESLDVPPHRVRMESFGVPSDVTKEPGWPDGVDAEDTFTIDVEGHGSIEAMAKEPLMISLERGGIVIPAQCRSGQCAACQTEVLSGPFFMLPGAWARESLASRPIFHACVTYPLGDLRIRVAPEK